MTQVLHLKNDHFISMGVEKYSPPQKKEFASDFLLKKMLLTFHGYKYNLQNERKPFVST